MPASSSGATKGNPYLTKDSKLKPQDQYSASQIEKRINYTFHEKSLLLQALTHKSYSNENKLLYSNERLEFLGDAVLNLVISDYLIKRFPDSSEGDLSKLRAMIVNEDTLSRIAKGIGLGNDLLLGKGEDLTGGREKPSILSDAIEALISAIYLDGGVNEVSNFVKRFFDEEIKRYISKGISYDFKTDLQEYCQGRFGILPKYHVTKESGPDHKKVFEVRLFIKDEPYGTGIGRTKKEADQRAAREALEKLKSEIQNPKP
jgi:ribonuclease-3